MLKTLMAGIQVRSISTSSWRSAIQRVTVIGGGLMGSGIAQVSAQTNHEVKLVDVSDDLLKKSRQNIETSLARVAKKRFAQDAAAAERFISDSLSRVTMHTDAVEAVRDAELVIEAIVENLESKQQLFATLDTAAPSNALFVSNTSSLSIKQISMVTTRPHQFGGLHFFNPVPVMKLLEVICIPETSPETRQALLDFGRALDKTTVEAKDTPGFIVNRLLVPFLAEAIRMLERGDASARDIDTAMKLGAGYPMGPFELLDYTGLDTNKFIMHGFRSMNPEESSFRPCSLLDKLVSEGKLGRKTGQGFYSYEKNKN